MGRDSRVCAFPSSRLVLLSPSEAPPILYICGRISEEMQPSSMPPLLHVALGAAVGACAAGTAAYVLHRRQVEKVKATEAQRHADELTATNEAARALEKDLAEHIDAEGRLKDRLSEMVDAHDQAAAALAAADSRLKEEQKRAQDSSRSVGRLRSQLEERVKDKDEAHEELRLRQSEVTSLRADKQALQAKIEPMEAKLYQLQQQVHVLEQSVTDRQTEASRANKDKTRSEEKMKELRARVSELEATQHTHREAAAHAEKEYRGELEAYRHRILELQENARHAVDTLTAEKNRYEQMVGELQATVRAREDEVRLLRVVLSARGQNPDNTRPAMGDDLLQPENGSASTTVHSDNGTLC